MPVIPDIISGDTAFCVSMLVISAGNVFTTWLLYWRKTPK